VWRLEFADIKDDKVATIEQLLTRRKPFACICFWENDKERADDALCRLDAGGLVTTLLHRVTYGTGVYDVLACQNICLNEIGDLHAFVDDYLLADIQIVDRELGELADRHLSDFFDDWDWQDSNSVPMWLTGLILGYPIENTISLYRQLDGNGRRTSRPSRDREGGSGRH
jgi:hypothetical protein